MPVAPPEAAETYSEAVTSIGHSADGTSFAIIGPNTQCTSEIFAECGRGAVVGDTVVVQRVPNITTQGHPWRATRCRMPKQPTSSHFQVLGCHSSKQAVDPLRVVLYPQAQAAAEEGEGEVMDATALRASCWGGGKSCN